MIPANITVPITFTLSGIPSAASWRVRGPLGVLQDWSVLDLSLQTLPGQILLSVPASLNAITSVVTNTNASGTTVHLPAVRESRLIDLLSTLPGLPPTVTTLDYVICANDELVVMQNSFSNYAVACELASEIVPMDGWNASTADQRIPALMQAYSALSRLNYEIYYDADDIYFRSRAAYGLPFLNQIGRLYNYSQTDFYALDPDFQYKVSRAQVIQADYLLGGDPIALQRESGIAMATTGQASHMFRAGKPLSSNICKQALRELSGYIKYNVKLVRG